MSELLVLLEEARGASVWKRKIVTLLWGKVDVATIRAVLEFVDDAFSEGVEAGQSDW